MNRILQSSLAPLLGLLALSATAAAQTGGPTHTSSMKGSMGSQPCELSCVLKAVVNGKTVPLPPSAGWKPAQLQRWCRNGEKLVMPPGRYTVHFNAAGEWQAPASMEVDLLTSKTLAAPPFRKPSAKRKNGKPASGGLVLPKAAGEPVAELSSPEEEPVPQPAVAAGPVIPLPFPTLEETPAVPPAAPAPVIPLKPEE